MRRFGYGRFPRIGATADLAASAQQLSCPFSVTDAESSAVAYPKSDAHTIADTGTVAVT
jgi:hypothetical protein